MMIGGAPPALPTSVCAGQIREGDEHANAVSSTRKKQEKGQGTSSSACFPRLGGSRSHSTGTQEGLISVIIEDDFL